MSPKRRDVMRALENARRLVRETEPGGGPVDIRRVAARVGVTSIEARTMQSDGYLGVLSDGGLVIRYRAQNSGTRNRFTIAHEVGHILLARAGGTEITRRADRGSTVCPGEEAAANRIAAELLMPEQSVQQALENVFASWSGLAELSRELDVSLTAMAWRVLELHGLAAILFRIEMDGRDASRLVSHSFYRSKHGGIRLVHPESFEALRLARDARRCAAHVLTVGMSRSVERLACEGMFRGLYRGAQSRPQYWVIGWAPRTL